MPEEITPTEPVLGSDGKPFDPERAQKTILNLRAVEHELTAERNWLRDSLKAMVSGRPLTPDQQAAVESVTPTVTAPQADLSAVAAILGADASDPASVVEAAKQSRLSAELSDIFHAKNLDVPLARSAINDQRLLVDIDVTADDLHEQLESVVAGLAERHPALKLRSQTATRSGMEIPAGSNGSPALPVSRESLAYMAPADVDRLRRTGQLSHLDIGPDRG